MPSRFNYLFLRGRWGERLRRWRHRARIRVLPPVRNGALGLRGGSGVWDDAVGRLHRGVLRGRVLRRCVQP